jgi:hypothetical protein
MPLEDLKIIVLKKASIFKVGSETISGTFFKSDPDPDPKIFEKSDPDP